MYVGTWCIKDGYLCLVGIHAHDREGGAIALDDLFHSVDQPIRAEWFSGVLRCPQGKRLKTILFGFDSV